MENRTRIIEPGWPKWLALVSAVLALFIPLQAVQAGDGEGGVGGRISTPPAPVRHRAARPPEKKHVARQPREERTPPNHAARPIRPAREKPVTRLAKPDSGDDTGSLDGTWSLSATGTCEIGNNQLYVASTSAVGPGMMGSMSTNGAIRLHGTHDGVDWSASGRLSGSRGSGTLTRSDGCHGAWSATKQ